MLQRCWSAPCAAVLGMLLMGGCAPAHNAATGAPLRSLAQGSYSGIDAQRFEVIEDAASFAALWREHSAFVSPPPPLLPVDFTREVVVAAFIGQRCSGGFSVAIEKLSGDNPVTVEIVIKTPAADCPVSLALRQPFQLAAAPRRKGPWRFHASWQDDVALEAARLRTIAPDALFADAPYRPLAAAQQADIPCIALCSLNWADIYQHYCGASPDAAAILAQITAAYAGAAGFLRPAPSMPMATLTNTQPVGPIARIGRARRSELVARCGGSPTDHYVLLSLGGIPTHLDIRRRPRQAGTHWIVPADWYMARADMTAYEELGLDFVDVLCSADLLLTKPGYGSFAEAACNGVPVLYVPRKTWPEAPYLECWLTRHGRCVPITWEQLERGDLSDALARLLAMAPTPPIAATGMDEAGDHLLRLLGASHSSSSEPTAP